VGGKKAKQLTPEEIRLQGCGRAHAESRFALFVF